MKNINHKYKILVKYLKNLINKIFFKNLNKIKDNYFDDSKSKISNFNKFLIASISILFFYLFYLSIPTLYNKSWVQNTLENKLLNEFKINFSISSEISYEILPSPHFTIKNAKILNYDENVPKELSNLKNLKIFISQSNLFKKENLQIKRISIYDANFTIQKNDFSFFKDLFNQKLSNKKIYLKKGNIFYKDDKDEIVSLVKIMNFSLFYDDKKISNDFKFRGEIFNLPFTLEFNQEISDDSFQSIDIESKKIKFNFYNESKKMSDDISRGFNTVSFFSSKFSTNYNYKKDLIEFSSSKLKSSNPTTNYVGIISLKPFDFNINVNVENLKIKKLFDSNSVYFEIFKNELIFNKNLSAKFSINSIEKNNRMFDLVKIILNINNGNINFDQTSFINDNIGQIKIINSRLFLQNDDLVFNTDINIDVKNSSSLFSFLQTPKKSRKPIKNIRINLDYNLYNDQIVLNNIKFDDLEPNKDSQDLIGIFNSQENKDYKNFIKNKNLFNRLIETYSG
tara:strand:+ start:977 stop:2506 length:1530 start_codon:yes stop_codon:yes gene_type:complete